MLVFQERVTTLVIKPNENKYNVMIENSEQSEAVLSADKLKLNIISSCLDPKGLKQALQKRSSHIAYASTHFAL